MAHSKEARMATAAVLILLGLALFVFQFVQGTIAVLLFLLVGALFVAGYLYWRAYGLLIPGCILLGIGLGSIGENIPLGVSNFSSIGLGIGFIGIYVIHWLYERKSVWWPFIPGGILILIGVASSSHAVAEVLSKGWPLLLVLAGLVVLIGRLRANRSETGKGRDA